MNVYTRTFRGETLYIPAWINITIWFGFLCRYQQKQKRPTDAAKLKCFQGLWWGTEGEASRQTLAGRDKFTSIFICHSFVCFLFLTMWFSDFYYFQKVLSAWWVEWPEDSTPHPTSVYFLCYFLKIKYHKTIYLFHSTKYSFWVKRCDPIRKNSTRKKITNHSPIEGTVIYQCGLMSWLYWKLHLHMYIYISSKLWLCIYKYG